MFVVTIHKRASWLCLLSQCLLAMAIGHASEGVDSNSREGIECETGRVVAYRLHRGWGYVDDIIIGREAELTSGCIRMPRGLSDETAKDNMAAVARWPGGVVPYFINPQITPSSRVLIAEAVKHFTDHSPIRFIPYTGQADFVGFEDLEHPITPTDESFCGGKSPVGRVDGGQPIWINQRPECISKGVLIHEMMHTLGFLHEHQRPDRNNFVAVPASASCKPDDYGIGSQVPFGPYDYASIMHYRTSTCLSQLRAFAIPLTLCGGIVISSIGQLCSLSDGDFFALWHFYRPAGTPQPALTLLQRNAALGVVLRTAKAPATSVAANPAALSGLWWGGFSESGWGIAFTQRGLTILAAWFTYDLIGNPVWYIASNCMGVGTNATSGTCSGTLYRVDGHPFFGVPFTPISSGNVVAVGNLQVTFQNKNAAMMTYSLPGQSRTVPIVRQPLATGSAEPAVDYTDLWWTGPQENGWGMSITQQYTTVFIAWYVYDTTGRPIWYVAPNCPIVGKGCSGTLYRTLGPPGPTFNAAGNQVFSVGSINVSFNDANNGTISYTVNGISGIKTITRQVF